MKNKSPFPESVREAATVVLVREQKNARFEIFLMRRHHKQSFMGGAFVFPGGACDPKDALLPVDSYCESRNVKLSLDRIQQEGVSLKAARGLFFTAIRETFEESGVLFARKKTKPPEDDVDFNTSGLTRIRSRLNAGTLDLKDIAEQENLVFTPGELVPYSRWITPEIEKKRFDTWFFLAKMPENQTPIHDYVELVDSLWVTPEQALLFNAQGKILLMPPTLKTIEELNRFSSMDRLFDKIRDKQINPILPQAISSELKFGVKLPHDPEYTIKEYKQPPRLDDPSRIMRVEGKWTTGFA